MNGALFFSGEYGSTAQYSGWISEATGLPIFDVNDARADPSKYEFLVLGSSVIIHKLTIRTWVKRNLAVIESKPTILFTVSGAPAGDKLDGWIADSIPQRLISKVQHVALQGRLDHKDISWLTKLILKIGAWRNEDPKAAEEELHGFDFMDKASIEPILRLVRQLQSAAGEDRPRSL